jgi:RNA ligase (TIGR02306 family)
VNLATVERIEEVTKHPNADKLDLVRVLNYWCIVGRDQYKVGDLIVFVSPDSVLPDDRAWAAPLLKYTSRGRVRAVRLRGEWSMGLVLSLTPELVGGYVAYLQGADLTELLGVTKHEPKAVSNSQAKGGLPFDIPKTDEDNWQRVRGIERYYGLDVDVTLKIDGQSFTAYYERESGSRGITSRSQDLKLILTDENGNETLGDSNWHKVNYKYAILDRLAVYCETNNVSLAIRGEVYGKGIQSFPHNPHSQEELNLAIYSVYNIDNRAYEGITDDHNYVRVARALGIPTVPVLEQVPLTRGLIDMYDHIKETVDGKPFEGVVMKGDGFSFKVINKHYDSKKD